MPEFGGSRYSSGYHRLHTGRSFYAYGGFISIDADLNPKYGYDGDIPEAGMMRDETTLPETTQLFDETLTPLEWIEICMVMISRWTDLMNIHVRSQRRKIGDSS